MSNLTFHFDESGLLFKIIFSARKAKKNLFKTIENKDCILYTQLIWHELYWIINLTNCIFSFLVLDSFRSIGTLELSVCPDQIQSCFKIPKNPLGGRTCRLKLKKYLKLNWFVMVMVKAMTGRMFANLDVVLVFALLKMGKLCSSIQCKYHT